MVIGESQMRVGIADVDQKNHGQCLFREPDDGEIWLKVKETIGMASLLSSKKSKIFVAPLMAIV
jgi:hypothetical protein